jgi:hypothetical protein
MLGCNVERKVNQLRKRAAFDEEEVEVTRKRFKHLNLEVNEDDSSSGM